MILKHKRILSLLALSLLVLFFVGQCTSKMTASEKVSPVYVGYLQAQKCRRVGPCQQFVMGNDFHFSIWWGNDLMSLRIGVDDRRLGRGTTEVFVKYVEVTVITPDGSQLHKNKNVKIYGENLKDYSGLYTTDTGVYTHTLIDENVTYKVKIDFEIHNGDKIENQSFEGDFKKGILKFHHPLV